MTILSLNLCFTAMQPHVIIILLAEQRMPYVASCRRQHVSHLKVMVAPMAGVLERLVEDCQWMIAARTRLPLSRISFRRLLFAPSNLQVGACRSFLFSSIM